MEHAQTLPAGRTELLLLLFHDHDQNPPVVIGVIVHNVVTNSVELRMVPNWDQFEESADVEVLRESSAYCQELLKEHGVGPFLEHLEHSLSNTIRLQRLRVAFDPGPICSYADRAAALLLAP